MSVCTCLSASSYSTRSPPLHLHCSFLLPQMLMPMLMQPPLSMHVCLPPQCVLNSPSCVHASVLYASISLYAQQQTNQVIEKKGEKKAQNPFVQKSGNRRISFFYIFFGVVVGRRCRANLTRKQDDLRLSNVDATQAMQASNARDGDWLVAQIGQSRERKKRLHPQYAPEKMQRSFGKMTGPGPSSSISFFFCNKENEEKGKLWTIPPHVD
ncbi:hypothetical protein IWZ00DRAFT_138591 [Phyllosticta capitalensis]